MEGGRHLQGTRIPRWWEGKYLSRERRRISNVLAKRGDPIFRPRA